MSEKGITIEERRGYVVTPFDDDGREMLGQEIVETEDQALEAGRRLIIHNNGLMGATVESVIITPFIKLTKVER